MNYFKLLSLLFATAVLSCVVAQERETLLALPAKQYLLVGVNNPLFIQTFTKYDDLGGDIVRFEGNAKYAAKGGRLAKSANINAPKCGDTIEVKLYDGRSFEVKESYSSVICAGEPKVGSNEVKVQFFGDSYTKGLYFKDAFLVKGYVPNLKLIGTRQVTGYEGQCHEGRGGWTLSKYFSNIPTDNNFFNPFFQPTTKQKYWGNVAFWKNATLINRDGGKSLSSGTRYDCCEFDTTRYGDNGFLKAPKKGDVMYDNGYVEWNGKAWKSIAEPSEWRFNYGKYLEMWELPAPDFLVVMLGLNDYRDEQFPLQFEAWNKMAEELLTSYKDANPQGKLLLSTPCTSCGVLDNERGDFTTRQNAAMWYVRENIIKNFDGREAEGLYVVDASINIDNENGYNMKGGIQSGNPHPYPNYPQLGVPLAASVQYLREK